MTVNSVAQTSSNSVLNAYLTQQNQNVAAQQAASTSSSATGLGGNLNTFLKILTTQLQNQDPTDATDTNQFTQELVQFAGVEQQLNTNTDLSTLINLQKSSSSAAASLSYIGKYIEAQANGQIALQNGSSEIGYTLPSSANTVTVTISDSTGKVVNTLTGPTTAGLNYITWDGLDSSGNQLPDGSYSMNLVANDAGGNALSVTDIRALGLVTSVQSNSDGTTSLGLVSGITVPSSSVDAVYQSGSLPASTSL